MEMKDIFELWNRFETSTISELDLEHQGTRLHLKKGGHETAVYQTAPSPVIPTAQPAPSMEKPDQKAATSVKKIKAPLVGMFYRASAPGAEPFVKEGQTFSKGDVIGIIEAMKCMNEVIAQEDGCVSEICAEDAQLIEYNQTILTYTPAGK